MTLKRWLAVGLCAVAGVAAAAETIKEGNTLYIRARNTRILASPSSTRVLAILQPGEKVTWVRKDPAGRGWHQIKFGGKPGVVLAANLSLKPVQMELISSSGKRATDTQSFISSGAATKALGPAAIEYGEKKKKGEAVHDVSAMEKIAQTVTTAGVAEHARRAGVTAAVGAVASGGVR